MEKSKFSIGKRWLEKNRNIKKIYPAYVSKHNWKTSFFSNDSKLRRMTLSCSKKKLNCIKLYKKVCEKKSFCNVIMPFEDTKILEFNQYQKSNKTPFIIYADIECLIEKIDGYKNNTQNLFNKVVRKNMPSGFLNVYNIII